MPLGDRDLVNGDVPQVLELGLGIAAREVALLDVLDHVPADAEMLGDVADCHAARQLQGIALEGVGVAAPRVGEGDLDLAHDATILAFDARDGQDDEGGASADGHGPEAPLDVATRLDLWRSAGGATAGLGLLVDGEDRLAVLVVGAGVLVAADAEGVIQQAGGHADLPVWSPVTQLQLESACPPLSTPAALPPDEPISENHASGAPSKAAADAGATLSYTDQRSLPTMP